MPGGESAVRRFRVLVRGESQPLEGRNRAGCEVRCGGAIAPLWSSFSEGEKIVHVHVRAGARLGASDDAA